MPGRLAPPALQALLAAEVDLLAIGVPAPPGAPPVAPVPASLPPRDAIALGPAGPSGLIAIAAASGLPVLALRDMGAPAVQATLAALAPDLICVACWPWRIPPALLALPRLGWLNLHPAPLPELRGPEPLFWALHAGRERSAVTLHWMDAGLDTGPVALAAPFDLPEGIAWAELESRAATVGAGLLRELLPRLLAGERPRAPQPAGGSYQPAPRAADFRIEPSWPAARAYRFMRGTTAWGQPYPLLLGGPPLLLAEALCYAPAATLDQPVIIEGATAHFQMSPGVLRARMLL